MSSFFYKNAGLAQRAERQLPKLEKRVQVPYPACGIPKK